MPEQLHIKFCDIYTLINTLKKEICPFPKISNQPLKPEDGLYSLMLKQVQRKKFKEVFESGYCSALTNQIEQKQG